MSPRKRQRAQDRRTFHLTYHLYYSTSYFLSFVQRERDSRQIGRDTYVDKGGPELTESRDERETFCKYARLLQGMRKNVARCMYVPPDAGRHVYLLASRRNISPSYPS